MTRRFRVVDGTNGVPSALAPAEAIEALLKECIASEPVTVMLVYEARNYHGKPSVVVRSYPESEAVKMGLHEIAGECIYPKEDE